MDWFVGHVLNPVLAVLYVPCDWLFGWTTYLGGTGGVVAVGVLSGAIVLLIQKYGSNQRLLAQCKTDLDDLSSRIKAAKRTDGRETVRRLRQLSGRISVKRMGQLLKPSIWTVPLFLIVGPWVGDRLGFEPVRPGQAVDVVAYFDDGASGFAHIVPNEGLRPEGPAIAALESKDGIQARWKVKASKEGKFPLTVRHADHSYAIEVPVAARGGRPPAFRTDFNEGAQEQDQLKAVILENLQPTVKSAWWNLKLSWMGLYLWAAMAVYFGLRFALKVQ